MASSRRADRLLFLPLALLHLLSSCPHTASGTPNTAPLSMLCNGAVYGAGDPFAESLAYVLADLLADLLAAMRTASPRTRTRSPTATLRAAPVCRAGTARAASAPP